MTAGDARTPVDPEAGTRRSNIRLALWLGAVAFAIYLGFVINGLSG